MTSSTGFTMIRELGDRLYTFNYHNIQFSVYDSGTFRSVVYYSHGTALNILGHQDSIPKDICDAIKVWQTSLIDIGLNEFLVKTLGE
jgi:hypothetical protein